MSYSKLIIKNFGKIKEAEIELSNLILFIGDNNSGKSYLMTLIYGLMEYSRDIVDIMFQNKDFIYSLEEYKKIKNIVDKYIDINSEIKDVKYISDCFFNSMRNNDYSDIYSIDKKYNVLKKVRLVYT